jgi:hypothetical protein
MVIDELTEPLQFKDLQQAVAKEQAYERRYSQQMNLTDSKFNRLGSAMDEQILISAEKNPQASELVNTSLFFDPNSKIKNYGHLNRQQL